MKQMKTLLNINNYVIHYSKVTPQAKEVESLSLQMLIGKMSAEE